MSEGVHRNNVERLGRLELVREEEEEELAEEVDDGADAGQANDQPMEPSAIWGNNSPYVKLISNDRHEFIIRRDLAERSTTIRDMLHGPTEGLNEVYLELIPSYFLERTIRYLKYQEQYLKKAGDYEDFKMDPCDSLGLGVIAIFLDI